MVLRGVAAGELGISYVPKRFKRRPYTKQHVACNTMNFCKFLVKYQ